VRKLAGIDFPGTPGSMTAILGDVELTEPPAEPVFQRRTPHGNWSVLTFEPGWHRVITNDFDRIADREAPITVDEAALTRPDPQTSALRDVMAGLVTFGDVNRSLSEMVAGLDIRYPLPAGAGHRVPDVDLPDGTRLYQHLHAARPVLLGDAPRGDLSALPWDGPATLIRPDGHVAWVSEMGDAALEAALDRWC